MKFGIKLFFVALHQTINDCLTYARRPAGEQLLYRRGAGQGLDEAEQLSVLIGRQPFLFVYKYRVEHGEVGLGAPEARETDESERRKHTGEAGTWSAGVVISVNCFSVVSHVCMAPCGRGRRGPLEQR